MSIVYQFLPKFNRAEMDTKDILKTASTEKFKDENGYAERVVSIAYGLYEMNVESMAYWLFTNYFSDPEIVCVDGYYTIRYASLVENDEDMNFGPDGAPEWIYDDKFENSLADMVAAIYGGDKSHGHITISLYDRYWKRGELIMQSFGSHYLEVPDPDAWKQLASEWFKEWDANGRLPVDSEAQMALF